MSTDAIFAKSKRIWRLMRSLREPVRNRTDDHPGVDRGFYDRLVTIDGSEYRYRIFVPSNWSRSTVWPVILSLHGGGGYGSDGIRQTSEGLAPAIRRHPERFPALAVFPQSPANLTPGWQAIGGRIALAALDQTIAEFNGDESSITLTGLSIGGNGVWHLAYHHPRRFAALLVVCGFVEARQGTMYPIRYPSLAHPAADPAAAVASRLAHTPTWIFHGDADCTVSVEHSRRMAAALRAENAPFEYTELPGVDHSAWDYVYGRADVISWLLDQRIAIPPKS